MAKVIKISVKKPQTAGGITLEGNEPLNEIDSTCTVIFEVGKFTYEVKALPTGGLLLTKTGDNGNILMYPQTKDNVVCM